MSNFLLVHGAWHGGWCWAKIASLLEAQGHQVMAPDLPGHGDDKTPTETVTLESYVDRICSILSTQKEPVVLAGHSMGGVVITQAAERCPDQIGALVYLCAFLPRNGESLLTWASQDRESMVNPKTTERRSERVLEFKREHLREAFYALCSEEDIALARSRIVDQALAPFRTPVMTTAERWGRIPRYYIECAQDCAITLQLQQEMQKHTPCRSVFSIDTDHSPFFSATDQLADVLGQIASQ